MSKIIARSRNFASDNNSGVHPDILASIQQANEGHALAYGGDPYTDAATKKIRGLFRGDAAVFFVFNGTAANVLALSAMMAPYHAVLCAETAHIHVDECGAPEKFNAGKLITLPTPDGKLTPALLERAFQGMGDQHHVQPRVVAISQATELGTVYAASEISALAKWAHARDMFLFVDGARIANAAVSLGCSLGEMLEETGVDAFSFGGTKNGLLLGEAVVFLNPALAAGFKFRRKQAMQLASKMRFLACQFEALLSHDLWLTTAAHANQMARLLASKMETISGVRITQKVEANGVFACLPRHAIAPLQEKSFFYVWNEERAEVRWMASWDTSEVDVLEFAAQAKSLLT